MSYSQKGILAPIPAVCRYLVLQSRPDANISDALNLIAGLAIDEDVVLGLGAGFVSNLKINVPGLRAHPVLSGSGCKVPSTQADLWCWIRGSDQGAVLHIARSVISQLSAGFSLIQQVNGFKYGDGRDLTGYEDGTENPENEAAMHAAIVSGSSQALNGSSFVAVQQWQHDLCVFDRFSQSEAGDLIGRRRHDNVEIEEAPASAHVKRTEQESFEPEAFLVRRSMPWADATGERMMFVAFSHSFDAFEAQLRRMVGLDDGIIDGLFRFTRPITGGYYWCPPVKDGTLDLSTIRS